ncbi:hypothetical protein [Streptomyces sp. SAI-218]|uniref:hypothetical protein n=1 Tax=Streptomyces sp. SAI-218 TaxID=3377736 RepID=UPI003C7B0594
MPWPALSSVLPVPLKSFASVTAAARSGWVVSMPVSRTATSTPLPSYPAAQAAGAPICATPPPNSTAFAPSSSVGALNRPSSQTRATPRSSVRTCHMSSAPALGTVIAAPATLGSSRRTVASACATSDFCVLLRRSDLPSYDTISGSVPRRVSS